MHGPQDTTNNPPLGSSQLTFPQLLKAMKEIQEKRASMPPRQIMMDPRYIMSPLTPKITKEGDPQNITCGIPLCKLWRKISQYNQ